jgi:uncharacterized cupin superfamily protein
MAWTDADGAQLTGEHGYTLLLSPNPPTDALWSIAICPYHFHWGDEERLVVVSGTPTVRTPNGEQMLEPGDVVCFLVGPEGAHRVHNASDNAARVALFSNKHEFGIIEYPDSDKIGVWGRHDESLDHVIRRSPDLDYWDGERP